MAYSPAQAMPKPEDRRQHIIAALLVVSSCGRRSRPAGHRPAVSGSVSWRRRRSPATSWSAQVSRGTTTVTSCSSSGMSGPRCGPCARHRAGTPPRHRDGGDRHRPRSPDLGDPGSRLASAYRPTSSLTSLARAASVVIDGARGGRSPGTRAQPRRNLRTAPGSWPSCRAMASSSIQSDVSAAWAADAAWQPYPRSSAQCLHAVARSRHAKTQTSHGPSSER